MRVAWLAGPGTLLRLERTLHPLAIGLIDEMAEITCLCPNTTAEGVLETFPFESFRYPFSKWLPMRRRTIYSLADFLVGRKINVLHALDGSSARLAQRLAEARGWKYLLSVDRTDPFRRLEWPDERLHSVLAASKSLKEHLAEDELPDDMLRILRPGVYHSKKPSSFAGQAEVTSVLISGRLDNFDHYAPILWSIKRLIDAGHECAFFLVGRGPADRRLRTLAERLEIRPWLTIADMPRPRQLAGILKAADVFITPGNPDAVDMTVLLAMSAGVAVLGGQAGVSDFIQDEQTAMVYDLEDPGDIYEKLTSLLSDPKRARAIGQNALSYVHAYHSSADMVSKLLKAYRAAVV